MNDSSLLTHKVELVLDAESTLGEGAIWDPRENVLWWIDIEQRQLHRYDYSSDSNKTIEIGQRIGAVVPRAQGGLMLALQNGFAKCDPESGEIEVVADPEAGVPANRFNDGKCDPAGRFWAGTMQIVEEDMSAGTVYCLHADGRVERKLNQVGVSNGIVWTSDRSKMYYIDSPTRRVDAFDYDNKTGAISDRRVSVVIPEGMGFPDGMTIDEEDNLWIALWGGWGVACFDPRNGRLLAKAEVPAEQVTSCAFGGPEFDRLYITTARRGIEGERLSSQPDAGGLFVAKVQARGVAASAYAG